MDFQKDKVSENAAFKTKYAKAMREKNRELEDDIKKAKSFNKIATFAICVLLVIVVFLGVLCSKLLKNIPETQIVIADKQNIRIETQAVKAAYYSDFMVWEPYTAITAKNTPNYKITRAATYDRYGLLIYDNCYLVALGSGWGDVGDKFIITLSNGNSFIAMIADEKANKDTDVTNRYCKSNGSILEFVINPYVLDKRIKKSGTVSSIPEFNGQIISIKKC